MKTKKKEIKLNILICSEYFYPSIGGAQKVSEELAMNFSRSGHNVTVATSQHIDSLKKSEKFKKKIKILRFKVSGNSVRGFKGDINSYQRFLIESKFDIILLYAAQQWSFDLVLPIIDKVNSNLFFAPCGFSKLNNFFYRDYFKKLPKYLKKFKINILHSKNYRDNKFLSKNKIINKVIIPNASDFPLLKPRKIFSRNIDKKKIKILNVSNLIFAKGQDLAIIIFLFLKIKKKANLFLYGNHTGSKIYLYYLFFLKFLTELLCKNKKIIFIKNTIRSDLVSKFYNSDIFLFTSRIECSPLVLYESASAGLPFVSTDVGNANEISKWTGCGIVKNNLFSIVYSINNLIFKDNKLNKMSISGKKNFIKRYNWKIISNEYLKIFKKFKKKN